LAFGVQAIILIFCNNYITTKMGATSSSVRLVHILHVYKTAGRHILEEGNNTVRM